MQYSEQPLLNVGQTGALMRRIAWECRADVGEWATLSPREFYNLLRKIPYRKDPPGMEYLQRPAYTMYGGGEGGDCDDKCLAYLSYVFCGWIGPTEPEAGCPVGDYRIVAVSKNANSDLHHVHLECKIGKEWVHVDPTYPRNTWGRPAGVYQKKVLI